jgi:hypothetical protein
MTNQCPDRNYLAMSEEELDLVLGEALLASSLGSKQISDTEKRTAAKNWFTANLKRIVQAVCIDAGVTNFLLGPQRKERNLLFVTVADALVKMFGQEVHFVPTGALAAKLIHYGIDNLCKDCVPYEKKEAL